MDKNHVSERFRDFAVLECEGSSELYEKLASQIATDDDVLELCLSAREGQPIPNLLLGAVHYLLLKGTNHQLQEYYPSVVHEPRKDSHLFEAFKDFCFENSEALKHLLKTKRVQTNEVRRCAYLYPVFSYIYQQTNKPLSLVEIGTSAGLQLLWDQYAYSYEGTKLYGNQSSFVHLTSEVRQGELPNHLLSKTPPVHDRQGLDLHISDVTNEEDYLWLKALIWPEHNDRLANFENAVKQLRLNPPRLTEGDGVALLTEVIKEIPSHTTLCVFHTHVANQMPESTKEELMHKVNEIGNDRDVFHVYNNIDDRKLHVDSVINGHVEQRTMGRRMVMVGGLIGNYQTTEESLMDITINQLTYDDAKALFNFEKENRIYFETMVPSRGDEYYDLDTFLIRHQQLLDEQLLGESSFFLIRESSGEILGRMNVVDIDSSSNTGHIGYRVGELHTGKGVAAKALQLFMHRLKKDGFTKVFAKTTTNNLASQRVLEKNGFIKGEVSEEEFEMNGQTFRFVQYICII